MKHERMKITSQHIIRLLAVILMMAGAFGGGNRAYADGTVGTKPQGAGTPDNPYRISNADEWKYYETSYLDKHFILTKDIVVETMFSGFDGTSGYNFRGTFDGMGHTLTFKKGSESSPYDKDYCAPFRKTGFATIKNLKIIGTVYVTNKFASGIVGEAETTNIQNCMSSLSIKSTLGGDGSHGGIVGSVYRSATTIQNCIFNGEFQGRNTHSSAGFVGCGLDNNAKCSIFNSIFDPSDVNYSTTGCATFSRCSTSQTERLFYKKTFGDAQGTDAQGWSDSKLYDEIKGGKGNDSWVLHCDTLYLKPFQRYVDITGWASGSSANDKFPKKVEGTRSNKDVIYSYYKFGETSTLPDGAPTEKGHYTVKASVKAGTDNDSHTWPAWESTMHFCVYDPPTKVERDYDASNSSLLTDKGSIDVGTFYYRFKKEGDANYSEWSTDVPSATEQGTYYIDYYIKGNGTHNDIGSPSVPAGTTITSKINIKSVVGNDLTVTFDPASFTYDGTAKQPAVTVKKGNNEVNSSEYKVAYSNNTNAGTATVTITDNKADGNYDIAQTTKTFTIEKEQLKATVTAKTLTYSGEAQELVSGSLSGTNTANCSIKYSSDGTNYTSTIPKGREAKTYTVYYKAEGDSNHKGTDAATVEVTISAKTVSNPKVEITPSSFTYDGTEKKPDVTVYDGTIEIDKSEYTVGYSNNTNAGSATVTITDADGGNYTVSGTGSFAILSEGSTYTPPTAKTGLVYNGTEQELLTAGSTTTGTMQYSSDGKTYSTDIPKGINAKTYTVYYKVVGDGNHKDSSPVSLTVTISEKTVSNPVITVSPSSYYYDGTVKKPSVTVKDGETEISSSEYTVSYTDNKNIGTATVIISDNDSGNYRVSGTANFSIIDPEKGETPMAKSDLVYNGSAQELITSGKATEGNKMVYSLDGSNYSSKIPTGTNAKTYTVYFKEVDAKNKDVTSASSLKATISPKTISITVKVSDNGNNRPILTITDSEGNKLSLDNFTLTYRNAAGKEIDSGTSILQPGDYTVTIKPKGNYTGSSITKSFRITAAVSFVFTLESDVMSVCLPYDCSVPSGYHVYYFDRVNEKGYPVFKRILTKKMGAGKPYLLRYAGSSSSTRGSRTVDLSPSNPALVDFSTTIEMEYNDGMLFKGTFEQINSTKAHADSDYVLQADNTWIHPADEGQDVISLKPFHAYLRYEDRSTPVSVMGMIMMATTDTDQIDTTDPNHPTGLDQIEFDDDTEQWYDLQGRRLDGPQRGVNIIRKSDGSIRKVVKK